MENASKALIIAGAILLSILIIGFGMFVYNKAVGVGDQIDFNSQEIASYNEPFEWYEGTQSGSQARALYSKIRTHNNGKIDDPTLQITLTINGGDIAPGTKEDVSETDATMDANTLKAGKTYNVTFAYDKNSGRIIRCNIQDKAKSTTTE